MWYVVTEEENNNGHQIFGPWRHKCGAQGEVSRCEDKGRKPHMVESDVRPDPEEVLE